MNPFQLICIAGILAAVTAAVPIFPPETERLSGFGTTLRKDFCLFSEGSIITRFEDIYLRSDNGEGWKLLDLTAIHDGTGMAPNPSLVGSCLILQTYPPNVSYDNGDTWEHLCTETSLEPYYSTPSIWGSGDTLFWFTFASDSSPTDAPRAHIVCKAGPGQIARPVGGTVPMPTSALNGMLLIDFADGPATSKDLGTTWTPIPASAAPVYSWALHGINGSIAASLRSDTLGITYDSGASWHKAVPPFSAIGYTITATADGGTWFAWDQAGAIKLTADSARTWWDLSPDMSITGTISGVCAIDAQENAQLSISAPTILAACTRGLFFYNPVTVRWQSIGNDTALHRITLDGCDVSGNRLLVRSCDDNTGETNLWASGDAGDTWTLLHPDVHRSGFINNRINYSAFENHSDENAPATLYSMGDDLPDTRAITLSDTGLGDGLWCHYLFGGAEWVAGGNAPRLYKRDSWDEPWVRTTMLPIGLNNVRAYGPVLMGTRSARIGQFGRSAKTDYRSVDSGLTWIRDERLWNFSCWGESYGYGWYDEYDSLTGATGRIFARYNPETAEYVPMPSAPAVTDFTPRDARGKTIVGTSPDGGFISLDDGNNWSPLPFALWGADIRLTDDAIICHWDGVLNRIPLSAIETPIRAPGTGGSLSATLAGAAVRYDPAGVLKLRFNAADRRDITVDLLSLQGRTFGSTRVSLFPGTNEYPIPAVLAAGCYLVRMSMSGETRVQRVMIGR